MRRPWTEVPACIRQTPSAGLRHPSAKDVRSVSVYIDSCKKITLIRTLNLRSCSPLCQSCGGQGKQLPKLNQLAQYALTVSVSLPSSWSWTLYKRRRKRPILEGMNSKQCWHYCKRVAAASQPWLSDWCEWSCMDTRHMIRKKNLTERKRNCRFKLREWIASNVIIITIKE